MNAHLKRGGSVLTVLLSLMVGLAILPAFAAVLPHGYVLYRTATMLVYGEPREIEAIRARLTPICTNGMHSAGLGPAQALEIIQVEGYAIAEGSCGNPELHAILRKADGRWMRSMGATCWMGGGAVPNYGQFGLYGTLIKKCGFPVRIANRIVGVRAGPTSAIKAIR